MHGTFTKPVQTQELDVFIDIKEARSQGMTPSQARALANSLERIGSQGYFAVVQEMTEVEYCDGYHDEVHREYFHHESASDPARCFRAAKYFRRLAKSLRRS